MDDMENELDRVIGEIVEASKEPLIKPEAAKPVVAAPFKTAFSAGVEGQVEKPFGTRPLSDAERKPIPPQHPVKAAPPPPPEQTTGWHGDPAQPQKPAAATPPAQAVVSRESTEAERFLATGERLLDVQRRKIQELESKHEIDRVKLIDDYRVQMLNLEHEANEALRSFDMAHDTALADGKRILDALLAMRG